MNKQTETVLETLQDPKTSPQARGKRVETLRKMTRLSRREFHEKFGISKTNMQNWEDAYGGGLSEKGARKIIAAVNPYGISCTFEWLMYGAGPSPQMSDELFLDNAAPTEQTGTSINDDDEATIIAAELLAFYQHYPRVAVDHVVADDGMEPRFIVGERVAGCKAYGKAIEKLVGLDCIVQIQEGGTLLRMLKNGTIKGRYTLACSNPNASLEKPILYDVELLSAAPVTWTRRKRVPT